MTDTPKPTASPADVLELLIGGMDRDIRARHPGAYGPPEDTCIGPAYPPHMRRLMLAYGRVGMCAPDDHAGRARRLDELAEAAEAAANAEWALHHEEGEG